METTSTSTRLQIDPNPQRTSGITHCCEPQVDRPNEWILCVCVCVCACVCVRVCACMCMDGKEEDKWKVVLGSSAHYCLCTVSIDFISAGWKLLIQILGAGSQAAGVVSVSWRRFTSHPRGFFTFKFLGGSCRLFCHYSVYALCQAWTE